MIIIFPEEGRKQIKHKMILYKADKIKNSKALKSDGRRYKQNVRT